MARNEIVSKIMESIDNMDGKTFSEFISEEGTFKFGNNEPVKGRKNIEDYVNAFFKLIKSSNHKIVKVLDDGESIVWQGEVVYTRHDNKEVTVPFVNVFNMEGDMIGEYLIYIDNTPLFAE